MKSCESEIQCLCNLAFAQSQLRDYNLAILTLTEALEKAQTSQNSILQFQACESLGTCYYHTSQYSEAVGAFNSAFQLLGKMQEDTSIAQDRVMGKLSDATRALQNKVVGINDHRQTTTSPEVIYKPTVEIMNVSALDQSMGGREKKNKGKQPRKDKDKERPSLPPISLQNQDSCDLDLQAYQDTLVSSNESDNEQVEQLHEEYTHPTSTASPNHHSHRTESEEATITPVSSRSSLLQGESTDSSQFPVTEGSLAIGPNARDTYTVQTSRTESNGKRNSYRSSNSEIVKRETLVEPGAHEKENTVPGSVSVRSKICRIM